MADAGGRVQKSGRGYDQGGLSRKTREVREKEAREGDRPVFSPIPGKNRPCSATFGLQTRINE